MLTERWSFSENGRRVKCKLPLTLVRALLLLCLVLDFSNARSPVGRWDVYLTRSGIGYRTAKTQVVVSDGDVVEQAYNYKTGVYRYTWSPWSEITACSVTCGTGVRYRKRYCHKSSGSGTHVTSPALCGGGPDRQYDICKKQDCLTGWRLEDLHRSQCSAFNRKPYRGQYLHWRPPNVASDGYQKKYGPCDIVCVATPPDTMYRLYRLHTQALDGTPCYSPQPAAAALCIAKKCIPIGCDNRVFSTLTFDQCGVCGGHNDTCDVIVGTVEGSLEPGFHRVVEIPAGARKISATDISAVSTAVFAIRNSAYVHLMGSDGGTEESEDEAKTGYKQHSMAGTTFTYSDGSNADDNSNNLRQLIAMGPTNETVFILIYSPVGEAWVQISYQFIIPKTTSSSSLFISNRLHTTDDARSFEPELLFGVTNEEQYPFVPDNKKQEFVERFDTVDKRQDESEQMAVAEVQGRVSTGNTGGSRSYTWRLTKTTPCSATCVDGIQPLYAECYSSDDRLVDDSHCQQQSRPLPEIERCRGLRCEPRWVTSSWSKCSTSCGKGVQYRTVRCWLMVRPGMDSTVSRQLCEPQPQPSESRACIVDTDCGPVWQTSEWAECSARCGPGEQRRNVRCTSGRDEECNLRTRPVDSRPCNKGACLSQWIVGNWSECSGPCGVGVRKRSVTCRDNSLNFQHDKYCNQTSRPLAIESCGDQATCPPVWVAQEWGVCSVECGEGTTTRAVVCGQLVDGQFVTRHERMCQRQHQPTTAGHCREKACKALWYTTEWSACSKSCGEDGVTTRRVECFQDGRPSLNCDTDSKPAASGRCHLPACEYNIDESCQDTSSLKHCLIVVEKQLCEHSFYEKPCCRSCAIERMRANATSLPADLVKFL